MIVKYSYSLTYFLIEESTLAFAFFSQVMRTQMKIFGVTRFICFLLILSTLALQAIGQSCDCPTNCSPCAGGITEYTLQYQGTQPALIIVRDAANVIFEKTLIPGELFVVKGVVGGGRFAGNKIDLFIDGNEDTTIDVACNGNTAVNSKFGHFVIVEAIRQDGKKICCPAGNSNDLIAPVFTGFPSNLSVNAEAGKCTGVVSWQRPDVSDCNLDKVTSNHQPGDRFPVGKTVVIYEAIDQAGNSSRYSFTITVLDHQLPVISSCPTSVEAYTSDEDGVVVSWNEPEVSDNCAASLTSSHSSNTVFPVGTTQVRYTASDISGNVTVCSFEVKVILLREPNTPEPPASPPGEGEEDIVVSRIITPDGDGKNDDWIIENLDQYPGSRVLVIDRWGNTIFSASGYNNDSVIWRGTGPGSRKLPAGTYFYVINYVRNGVSLEKKGFIELIQ